MKLNRTRLTLSSLKHYWRWQTGLALGIAVAAAVIAGSLVTGDSVRATLARQAELRLGKAGTAVAAADGFFTEALAGKVPGAAPVLLVQGTVSVPGGERRANAVNIYGVRPEFWKLAYEPEPQGGAPAAGGQEAPPEMLGMNEALARVLGLEAAAVTAGAAGQGGGEEGAAPGAEVIVRFEKPALISRDAPLSGETDLTVTMREPVGFVAGADRMGPFSLKADQEPALNVYVPLKKLQEAAELPGMANLLLTPEGNAAAVSQAVQAGMTLEDAGLGWTEAGGQRILSTGRIFLAPPVVEAAKEAVPEAKGVLTYLVNQIVNEAGQVTPYSMATAAEPGTGGLPVDWPEETVLISQWLADDLSVKPGDTLTVKYFRVTRARQLEEAEAAFPVHAVLPMDHPAIRREWTPDFPGVTESENCRDWKPGIPIDQSLIRDKDDAYWKERKGTPKIFLRLNDGQKRWANRFGSLTALWVDSPVPVTELEAGTRQKLTAAEAGLVTVGVREAARQAVAQSMDFGALFVSMSAFLIGTAVLLAVLLFLFGTSQRAGQIGLLRAAGWTPKQVRRLFLAEAAWVAVPAAAAGTALGLLHTRWTLGQLAREWSDAALGLDITMTVKAATLLTAWLATVLLSLAAVWFAARKIGQARPAPLLAGAGLEEALAAAPPPAGEDGERLSGGAWNEGRPVRRWRFVPPGLLALLGVTLLVMARKAPQHLAPMFFFGAAAMLLADGLRFLGWHLRRTAAAFREDSLPTLWNLGVRNAVRRSGRSMAMAALLASGIFMVVALNAFRQDARLLPSSRESGTGGFALAGTSTLPVYEDLNTRAGREVWGLDDRETAGISVVPFRVREGEEASCLNLNRAQTPRVLGVEPRLLAERNAFPAAGTAGEDMKLPEGASVWTLLDRKPADGTIPAIMDQYSAMFALGKQAGGVITVPDGQGRPVRLRLVALLAGTVLQGNVIISDAAFVRLYPDTGGYRYFLVDAPEASRAADWSALAMRQMAGRGLALEPAAEKLARYQAVQNTYLTIFSTLGGLALLLSTLGLGVLVARHVLERKAEFAVLQAVGFRQAQLRRMVLAEHWFLFLTAVALGAGTALLAVWPNLKLAGAGGMPVGLLGVLLISLTAGGLVFCHLAARLALSRRLTDSLRHE